ncbi:MAG: radical SAM protein [Candidatus Woesearchaeota archaeon]|jgi:cyclic pyranopterin phosphate synthase|nr:radical SAM protein [Candidatus Woesearchaeota archaeon]|tara:strand:- start:66 stop:566 length:501 start_codon:yes stop_codon:yes gene_type:complete
MATDKIPYLTIAITNRCNFHCYYCSPDEDGGMGEAYGTSTNSIDIKDLEEKILIAEEEGMTKVRFSGGEPLLIHDITDVFRFIEDNTTLEYALATNGSIVDRFVDDFEGLSRLDIRISLDTLDRGQFSEICGCSKIQYDKVIANIKVIIIKKYVKPSSSSCYTRQY